MARHGSSASARGAEVKGSVPQVKICGLTGIDDALECARLGASAIGLVFYRPSPRFVGEKMAGRISRALPAWIAKVGVFVDHDLSEILRKVEACGLDAVQLHGREPPRLVSDLTRRGVRVIKALFVDGSPPLQSASSYRADAFLVEAAAGPLPGGNAMSWGWERVDGFAETHPLVLAGGLSPENVSEAVRAASPDALDVSSAVESRPGRKDPRKVERFIRAVEVSGCRRKLRRIF